MDWIAYNNGRTINTIGSESGRIISDLEHIGGARITIEKGGSIAPYSLTLGIYDLMFHTYFASSAEEINKYAEFAKSKIQEILFHYEIPEGQRDKYWQSQLNQLLEELTNEP